MVTAEVLESEKKKQEENEQIEAEMASALEAEKNAELRQAEEANISTKKKKRRAGPMVAA